MSKSNQAIEKSRQWLKWTNRLAGLLSLTFITILVFIYFQPSIVMFFLDPNEQEAKNFIQNLAVNLIAVLCVFVISYYVFRFVQNEQAQVQEHDTLTALAQYLDNWFPQRESIVKSGVVRIYEIGYKADFRSNLHNQIATAHNQVKVLLTWSQETLSLQQHLKTALQESHGLEIKILLLDPHSQAGQLRRKDLGQTPETLRTRRTDMLKLLDSLQEICTPEQLQAKYYLCLPALQMIICDNRAFISFFWHGKSSEKGPQIEVQIRDDGQLTYFGSFVEDEFKKVWDRGDNKPVQSVNQGSGTKK